MANKNHNRNGKVVPRIGGEKCMGKISYLTKKDAKLAIVHMRASGLAYANELQPFHCAVCGLHHLGKNKKNVPRRYLREHRISRAATEMGDP